MSLFLGSPFFSSATLALFSGQLCFAQKSINSIIRNAILRIQLQLESWTPSP
jgi:hypothetical protein